MQELEIVTNRLAELLVTNYDLKCGDHVLLVFMPCLAFMISLLACFKAGIVGVPAYPPNPSKMDRDLILFCGIASDCGAKLVISHQEYNYVKRVSSLTQLFSWNQHVTWPNIPWLSVDSILSDVKKQVFQSNQVMKSAILENRALSPVAFLQYTSGSTSSPKGVMVTHENIAYNTYALLHLIGCWADDKLISWLPQYHDMGLIGKCPYKRSPLDLNVI
jgi:acyl-CoA synthetase (AMP-forming)/AMP-acid ligase II